MNTRSNLYYLSLGSNLGNKAANIENAIDFLRGKGKILKISPLYETEPVGMEPDTEDFYNLVLNLQTPPSLSPLQLLREIKKFESSMKRDISHSHNLPRTIDIDILLADDRVIKSKELTIPHQEMTKRAFVLVPFCEIAPDVVHPVLEKTIKEILEQLPQPYRTFKIKKIPKPPAGSPL